MNGMKDDSTRPVAVEPREGFSIWIQFHDGEQGVIDLTHLSGIGMFKSWEDRKFFESVEINSFGEVAWGDEIDLCPDSLYLELTGKPIEEVMTGLVKAKISA